MAVDTNNPHYKECLARLYQSGKYADLTIACDGHTFTVHKSVICMQSSFFEKACKKDTFMEGVTGVVDLPDDDPVAVKAMIEFLYLGSYSYDQEPIQWSLHVKVATIADKYDINPLENFAYGVLEKAKSDLPDDKEFAAAARWTYKNMGAGGSGRRVIVEVAVRHLKALLGSEAFSNVVGEVAELGRDILIANQEVKEKILKLADKAYLCDGCESNWVSSDGSDDCPCCNTNFNTLCHSLPIYQWGCNSCDYSICSSFGPAAYMGNDSKWTCPSCGKRGFRYSGKVTEVERLVF